MDSFPQPRATISVGIVVVLLVGALLGGVVATSGADAAQPVPQLITEEMQRQLVEQGSVMVSVTYQSAAGTGGLTETFQAEALPRDPLSAMTEGMEVLAVLDSSPAAEIKVTSAEALVQLASDPDLRTMVIPPYQGTFSQTAVPELRGAQRDLAVEASQMHARGNLGGGVTVAIIDTGVDRQHVDLVSSVTFEGCVRLFDSGSCPDGTNFQTGPGSAAEGSGHGTQMASAVTSDGIATPLGIAPEASIEALSISSTTAVDLRNALVALDFILESRGDVDIVMLSFGSSLTFETTCNRDLWPAFFDAVQALRDRNIFVTSSTGNSSLDNGQTFPACLDHVYSVTSLNVNGTALATSANIASSTDVTAPGSGIAVHNNETSNGTSVSNALVAGCAALAIDSGQTTPIQIGSWLKSPNDLVVAVSRSVPTLQCAPQCLDQAVTVNLELGETPTNNRDVVLGTPGNDVILAGFGDDVICAEGGDDLVFGGQGNDQIAGGGGADRLWGNFGDDVMFGGDGADTLHGSAGTDELFGQLGDDRLYGYAGRDVLSGGQGNDRLHGNDGADVMRGDPGNDVLFGYRGDDQIDGGIGDDTCRGNAGTDLISRCETPSSAD